MKLFWACIALYFSLAVVFNFNIYTGTGIKFVFVLMDYVIRAILFYFGVVNLKIVLKYLFGEKD